MRGQPASEGLIVRKDEKGPKAVKHILLVSLSLLMIGLGAGTYRHSTTTEPEIESVSVNHAAPYSIQPVSVPQAKPDGKNQGDKVDCQRQSRRARQSTTVPERNLFLIEFRKAFDEQLAKEGRTATPEEEAAFQEMVAQNTPVEYGVDFVMSDDPTLLPPEVPDKEDLDSNGRPKLKRFKDKDSVERFAAQATRHGCRGERGTQFVSFSASATTWVPNAWYYCVAEAYAKNVTGQKIIRLVQTQDWQISGYGTILNYQPVDPETYGYLFWKTSGPTTTTGPSWYTVDYAKPWQMRSTAKQKFIFDYKVITIQNRYLSTAIKFGPANSCWMSPGKGPGMP